MSKSPLTDLALHIGKLLTRPENMALLRRMAESCLADYRNTFRPVIEQMADSQREVRIEPYADLTAKQTALVVAALHDVCCDNIEKVIDVEKVMAGMLPIDTPVNYRPVAVRDCGKRWSMLLNQVQNLPESSAPWFNLHVRKFESIIRENEGAADDESRRQNAKSRRQKAKISPVKRTKPMTFKQAAKFMGKGDSRDAAEWLSKAVKDGSVQCEHITRQTHVFSLEDFPKNIHKEILPK